MMTGLLRGMFLAAAILLGISSEIAAAQWAGSWAAAPVEAGLGGTAIAPDSTVRQAVRIAAGGARLRLRLSNELSTATLAVDRVRVAIAGPDGRVVPDSERDVLFAGKQDVVIPPGAPMLSDPVTLPTPPLTTLLISLHLPQGTDAPTIHTDGAQEASIAPGDTGLALPAPGARTTVARIALSGVDVDVGHPVGTIVAIGDSITDGAASTPGANRRWPDVLAERLVRAGRGDRSVINQGIGGNRILSQRAGPSLLARIDRDVLAVPSVSHVIILEGINDIGVASLDKDPTITAERLIAGQEQLIARARARGIKVIGATILPYGGAFYYRPEGEAIRRRLNGWIRTGGAFDGVVDFDRAVRDPAAPDRMLPAYDSGDRLHPSDAGYRAMAEAVDLNLFRR